MMPTPPQQGESEQFGGPNREHGDRDHVQDLHDGGPAAVQGACGWGVAGGWTEHDIATTLGTMRAAYMN